MTQHIAHTTVLVKEYDEAISYFTQKLNFKLIQDINISELKRWVIICPPGSIGGSLLLSKATNDQQLMLVGNQAGGKVFLFLYTDDFWRDYKVMSDNQIKFLELPREEPHGTVVVFEDLYGNKWDFIQPK
jgi:catechol 2,3-dioxygenase-like lactoylglutathione lyase family enzyme